MWPDGARDARDRIILVILVALNPSEGIISRWEKVVSGKLHLTHRGYPPNGLLPYTFTVGEAELMRVNPPQELQR